jgi:hypothetical protein
MKELGINDGVVLGGSSTFHVLFAGQPDHFGHFKKVEDDWKQVLLRLALINHGVDCAKTHGW